MARKYNILVFPCGSEIGLEIHRSLKYAIHVNLIGANSMDDHGKFVYERYIGDLPFVNREEFIPALKKVIEEYKIDAIYPAMDNVITKISACQEELGCRVIASPAETTAICLSKTKTYDALEGAVNIPKVYSSIDAVDVYPVFMKPAIGYGSRGAKLIHTKEQATEHLAAYPTSIILENLPGAEYTVDCFTNRKGELLFSKPRKRNRVSNGISVNTKPVYEKDAVCEEMAKAINNRLKLRGAWFFQVKENTKGDLSLLEVASRLGGSSSLYRNLGVNFALLSVFDAFDYDVNIFYNDYHIELDRALDNKYKLDIEFNRAYIDFDDCLLLVDKVNTALVALLYQFLNEGKELILITKHEKDIHESLRKLRLDNLFHQIIHLTKDHRKYEYMQKEGAIFIDDSHAERFQVHEQLGIPVFAPDNIECLLK